MRKIPDSTVRRLAVYLQFLEEFEAAGTPTVSSHALAERGGTTAAQVRKDLSFFGSFGKRGLGYAVPELGRRLRAILGLDRRYRVAVVGAGRVGSALAQYAGFAARGFDIVAVFDSDPAKIGRRLDTREVRDARTIEPVVAAEGIEIGIVVTPAAAAQEVADGLVAGGVRAILNFAPAQLVVPPDVELRNVNLALELETLSYALAHR